MTFCAILAILVGAASGLLFLYIGFNDNNQGEYYDPITRAVDLPYSMEMFLISFLPPALLTLSASLTISSYFFKSKPAA